MLFNFFLFCKLSVNNLNPELENHVLLNLY